MKIAVLNDDGDFRQMVNALPPREDVNWQFTSDSHVPEADFAIVMQPTAAIIQQLQVPALINETTLTFSQMKVAHKPFARFCGWPGFAQREKWEVAVCQHGPWLEAFGQLLNKELVAVADAPGLVAPRILAMIINEACYGLADGICSASDMDTAMKLGTNYPKGPVAWMEEIGKEKIAELLFAMAKTDNRYSPHPMLTES
jgi:hypothetical protein